MNDSNSQIQFEPRVVPYYRPLIVPLDISSAQAKMTAQKLRSPLTRAYGFLLLILCFLTTLQGIK